MVVGLRETRIQPIEMRFAAFALALLAVEAPAACAVGLGLGLVARVLGELLELPDRHFVLAEVERLRDPHAMLGVLVLEVLGRALDRRERLDQFFGRFVAAHLELAGRDQHQLHADGIGDRVLLLPRGLRLIGPGKRRQSSEQQQATCGSGSFHRQTSHARWNPNRRPANIQHMRRLTPALVPALDCAPAQVPGLTVRWQGWKGRPTGRYFTSIPRRAAEVTSAGYNACVLLECPCPQSHAVTTWRCADSRASSC